MAGLILRKLAGLAATLLVVSAMIFALASVLPGDQASIMLGTSAAPETLDALRAQLGLDQPAPLRFLNWLGHGLTGDLGTSFTYGVPVGGLVLERLAVTLPLAFFALALAALLALPLATAAARGNALAEFCAGLLAQTGIALPSFFIGLLLILWLSGGAFPGGGFPGWQSMLPALAALFLPALALAIPQAAVLVRVARGVLRQALRADYIRTARAKGLGDHAVMLHHVMPAASGPILTLAGLQFSYLVAGTVLVENVFALPGLGRLAFQALQQRDVAVLQACALLFVALVIIVNFIVDLIITANDPRLRS